MVLRPVARRPPAAQRRPVGPDPCFVDEHQALRIEAWLQRLPALTFAGNVPAELLKPEQGLLKAEPLGLQEAPEHIMTDAHAAGGLLARRTVEGQVRGLLQAGDDPVPVRLQNNRTVVAAPARLQRSGAGLKLRPFHHRGRRNAEPGRQGAATLTAPVGRPDVHRPCPLTKIDRTVLPVASLLIQLET